MDCIIESVDAEPLDVPLHEPFVIASGEVSATQSVLVRARLRSASGEVAEGLGEGAALPPVTRETGDTALENALEASGRLTGRRVRGLDAVDALLADVAGPVARAALETALLDALARLGGVPLRTLLGAPPEAPTEFETDITLPIATPAHARELALRWRERGFRLFKVKVGRDVDSDVRVLEAVYEAVPDARLRVDANAGYSVAEALAAARAWESLELPVEAFEQPCGRLALEAMAEVTANVRAPVIADESVASLEDLRRVLRAGAARGVNLKLSKSGGPLSALAIGREARASGMRLMCGAMVETRLGLSAAAHVLSALGGAEFVDLDTAWLLRADPFAGGHEAQGPALRLCAAPGLGMGLGR